MKTYSGSLGMGEAAGKDEKGQKQGSSLPGRGAAVRTALGRVVTAQTFGGLAGLRVVRLWMPSTLPQSWLGKSTEWT